MRREEKRRCAGDDGKGKERKLPPFPSSHHPRRSCLFLKLLFLPSVRFGKLCTFCKSRHAFVHVYREYSLRNKRCFSAALLFLPGLFFSPSLKNWLLRGPGPDLAGAGFFCLKAARGKHAKGRGGACSEGPSFLFSTFSGGA